MPDSVGLPDGLTGYNKLRASDSMEQSRAEQSRARYLHAIFSLSLDIAKVQVQLALTGF